VFTLLITGIIALGYGAFIAFSALKKMRQEKISLGIAALIGLSGLSVMAASLFIPFQIKLSFYILLIALIAMHSLTLTHEKVTSKQSLIRVAITLLLLVLSFTGIFMS
jgi:hypothetical protein